MVKYNKKFFFGENSSSSGKAPKTRRKKESNASLGLFFEKVKYFSKKLLPIIGILVLILLIVVYVKGCNAQKKKNANKQTPVQTNPNEAKVRDTLYINLNDPVPGIERFVRNYSSIKTNADTITYDETNLVEGRYIAVGEYKVSLTIGGQAYTSRIIVSDKEAPSMALQEVIITEGEYYTINDFISSCSDNSGKECAYNYVDEAYGKYTAVGTYDISIIGSDLSGNKTDAQSTKLTIKAKETNNNGKSGNSGKSGNNGSTCQYGDGTSSVTTPITYNLVKNGCAIDPAYAKTSTYITIPEKMGKEDLDKLKQDFIKSGIQAEIQTEFNVIPIFNATANGLIGYQDEIIAKNNKTGEVIEHYYINANKSRTYVVNKLNFK